MTKNLDTSCRYLLNELAITFLFTFKHLIDYNRYRVICTQKRMKKWLIQYLQCPQCQGNYTFQETEKILKCEMCGVCIPVKNGIPRFVELSEKSDSFGFEWHKHKLTQLDSYSGFNESEAQFKNRIDFPIEDLKGKLVLDAGCGMGRYAEIAVKYGAQVVCVDLSYAIDSAYGNLHHFPNVSFLQADLFSLPFKKNIFDFIYSFGVLHHTPNAEQAFKAISSFLKNEGKISMFVYASYTKGVVYTSNFWRFFTTKIPYKWLHYMRIFLSHFIIFTKYRTLEAY